MAKNNQNNKIEQIKKDASILLDIYKEKEELESELASLINSPIKMKLIFNHYFEVNQVNDINNIYYQVGSKLIEINSLGPKPTEFNESKSKAKFIIAIVLFAFILLCSGITFPLGIYFNSIILLLLGGGLFAIGFAGLIVFPNLIKNKETEKRNSQALKIQSYNDDKEAILRGKINETYGKEIEEKISQYQKLFRAKNEKIEKLKVKIDEVNSKLEIAKKKSILPSEIILDINYVNNILELVKNNSVTSIEDLKEKLLK